MAVRTLAAVAIALVTLLGTPAFAQAPVAPAPPAAPKPPRDPQLVAAARDYVRATELASAFARQLPVLSEQVVRQVQQRNPQATPEAIRLFSEALFDEFLLKRAPEIEALVVEAVLDTFTREEIAALRTFWTSPIGRSVQQKQPTLLQKMPAALQEWTKRAMPDSVKAAGERVKAQGRIDLRL